MPKKKVTKAGRTVVLSARVPRGLRDAVVKRARAEKRTPAGYVAYILAEAVKLPLQPAFPAGAVGSVGEPSMAEVG